MIKLKKIIKESYLDRKFGEPLPTFDSVMKDHQLGKVYTDKDRPPFQVNEAKELDQKSIDFIAKLTHHNNHTRSRLELANHMRDKRLIRAYQGIMYVEELLGDSNDTSKARYRLDKQLWYKAKKMYSNFDDIFKAY
jgi:hypothetical protein